MKQIVIEISEQTYKSCCVMAVIDGSPILKAIANGTVLPDHECLIVYYPQGEDNKITILDSKKEGE